MSMSMSQSTTTEDRFYIVQRSKDEKSESERYLISGIKDLRENSTASFSRAQHEARCFSEQGAMEVYQEFNKRHGGVRKDLVIEKVSPKAEGVAIFHPIHGHYMCHTIANGKCETTWGRNPEQAAVVTGEESLRFLLESGIKDLQILSIEELKAMAGKHTPEVINRRVEVLVGTLSDDDDGIGKKMTVAINGGAKPFSAPLVMNANLIAWPVVWGGGK
jgi:hypothetical protein